MDELAARNKKRYGDKAPNLQGTIMGNVGVNTEKYPINDESTLQKYPVNEEKYPVNSLEGKKLGKTALRIIELIENNPKVTREQLASLVGISLDGVKKQVKSLRDMGILVHEGSDKTGYWRIITNDNE